LQQIGRSSELAEAPGVFDLLKEEIAQLEANLRGYAGQKSSPHGGANPEANRRGKGSKRKSQ
jgi:hypothetical protein